MNRLIIVKTHYQIIFAIQMRKTILANDYVTLLVCDHSNNADVFSKNISELSLFNETHFIQTLGTKDNRTNYQKMEDFVNIAFRDTNRYKNFFDPLMERFYDELLVYNYSIETYGVFALLSSVNKDIIVSRFEEGILSYNGCERLTFRRKIINWFRKKQKKPVIEERMRFFYCFYPDLYTDDLQPVSVPAIEMKGYTSKLIQEAFEVDPDTDDYRRKYIFFTSVYDFEGGDPIGEYQLVCRVAELVGKDNLLLKIHPRDTRSIYKDNGFIVDKNSSIPWEAIQLSGDFSDKVFMTATSGSVLAASLMSDKPSKTLYMYKLCNIKNNPSAIKSASDIESLLDEPSMKNLLKTVHIAEHIEDIL